MPTWRKLHAKTTESLDLDAMPDDFTRLLWLMLPLKLCKHGRGLYSPAWVRSKIFPLRDDVTQDMVGAALEWFTDRKMLIPYEVEGRSYFFVPSFSRYQGNTAKETESDYPASPDQLQSNAGPTQELVQSNSGVSQELVQSNSRPTPDQVESKSASDADADADADADIEAAAEGTDAAVTYKLVEWGVSPKDAVALVRQHGEAEVEAMYCFVAGKAGVANPAGLLISKLENGDRAPPPERTDRRRFIEHELVQH